MVTVRKKLPGFTIDERKRHHKEKPQALNTAGQMHTKRNIMQHTLTEKSNAIKIKKCQCTLVVVNLYERLSGIYKNRQFTSCTSVGEGRTTRKSPSVLVYVKDISYR